MLDDSLAEPRESAAKSDPELTRYRAAGAGGEARFAFPASDVGSDSFYMTELMGDYSQAVVLEGDDPLRFADLRVFVAPPLAAGGELFVRHRRDRAEEARERAQALERLLREPDGAAQLLGHMVGDRVVEVARKHPEMLEEYRANLLEGIARAEKAPPPQPTERWAIAEGYAGMEHSQLVVVNVRGDDERRRGERLIEDLARLRKDDALFDDILGVRGNRIPITAVVADLSHPKDAGRRKALARVRRAINLVGS